MQRIKNIFVHNIKLIVLLVCVLSVVIFAIAGSSYTVHAAETKSLNDLQNEGIWNYERYGRENNMIFKTSYGGFSDSADNQADAKMYIIYRKVDIPAKNCLLYTTECDHIQGLETTANIYARRLTEEEYTHTAATEFNMEVGKYVKTVFSFSGESLWGNSTGTSLTYSRSKTCKATDPSCRIIGEARAEMFTYYLLTINISRELIWTGSGSGKRVVGYKNYKVSINESMSGEYTDYEKIDLKIWTE